MVSFFTSRGAHRVRKGAQVLRSFGKQWEAVLPTFLLRINEVDENCAVEKNCAVSKHKTGIRLGGGANAQEIYFGQGCLFNCLSEKVLSALVSFPNAFGIRNDRYYWAVTFGRQGPAKGSSPAETASKVTVIVYCIVVAAH
jgi:hypothetical protein